MTKHLLLVYFVIDVNENNDKTVISEAFNSIF